MNEWSFVAAAYGLTGLATALLACGSWIAMRRAEAAADAAKRR